MKTFHMRQPLSKRGGSSFYRDRSPRKVETLCGASSTQFDVRYGGKIVIFDGYQYCSRCRAEFTKARG